MKLENIIPLLPKYDCNNAYGKKGEVKYGDGKYIADLYVKDGKVYGIEIIM